MPIKLQPEISSVGQTFAQGLRVGYTPTIDPGPFVRAYDSTIRAGQQLQNLGAQGVNVALKEQDVYNTTQINSTNATRKVLYSKLKTQLLQPENFDAHKYEQNLSNGLLGINKVLEKPNNKQIYNPYLKGLIQAEGSAFYASQISSIQKEARVFRVKALKAQGLENIRLLRQEELKMPDIPSNQLLRQGIDATMMQLVDDMVAGGLLDPDDGVKEKNKIFKDREDAKIRKVVDNATRMSDVHDVLDKSQYQDEDELALYRIRAKDNIRTNRQQKIAEEKRLRLLGKEKLETLQEENARDFDARIFDPEKFSGVTITELREARDNGLIKEKFFVSRVNMIHRGDPYADRPTDPDEYDKVEKLVEQQLKYPDRPIIKNSEIYDNPLLGNDVRNILSGRLRSRTGTLTDNKRTTARSRVEEVLNIKTLTKMGNIAAVKKKKRKLVEFDMRTMGEGKEDPDEVAEEMIKEELGINKEPLSKISQIDTNNILNEIPQSIRRIVKSPDGVVVPKIREMLKQANAGLESKLIDDDEYTATIDALEELQLKWSPEMIEKHGGIKSQATIKKEKLEKQRKAKEDKEKLLQKIEDDKRLKEKEAAQREREEFFKSIKEGIVSLPGKVTESVGSAVEKVKESLTTTIPQSGIDSWVTSGDQKLIDRLNQPGGVPQDEFLEILAEEYSKTDFHSTAEIYKAAQSLDIIDDLSKEQLAILNVFKNELNSRADFGFVDWKHSSKNVVGKESISHPDSSAISQREPSFALDLSDMTVEDISEELKRLEYWVTQRGADHVTKIYKENLLARKKELE